MRNVQKNNLAAVIAVLPAINSPTVSSLSDAGWHAVNTILPDDLVRTVVPRLKSAGATGIVEYPLNKVVL
jgi:ATP phosphoribosyltransferase